MLLFANASPSKGVRRGAIVARLSAPVGAALVVAASAWCSSGTATAAVAAPDLSGYEEVAVPTTVDFRQLRHMYFTTPGGLHCDLVASQSAGCGASGGIPGSPHGATAIVVGAEPRGFRTTAASAFTGDASTPVVHKGQKVRDGDVECAVTGSQGVACTTGSPVAQWLVVSPEGSGIGPATAGLPDGFPDPIEFVADDGGYKQASGLKNTFRSFTIDRGLTCQIKIFSGGDVGCDGTLPGVQQGENEVFYTVGRGSQVRHVDTPNFTPTGVGPIQRMPVGHRLDDGQTTCMATAGGVACISLYPEHQSAFQVTSTSVITY